jgi:Zn-dependent protease
MSEYDPYAPREAPKPEVQYDPIRRRRTTRQWLERLAAPLAVLVGLAIKFGAISLKFFGIFISVGAYALIWGWHFAVGFVLLIFVHELGHFLEARRQGLHPALPVFIPFLGAYVAIKDSPFDPWRNGLVSIAGPIAGGIGTLAVYVVGDQTDSRLLLALAYTGFFLNLFNLIPIGFLDGGFILRSIRLLRRGAGDPDPARARRHAVLLTVMYGSVAALLLLGMLVAHVPQDRL